MTQCRDLFARLVRLLLGETAISVNKLEAGLSLVVLGILVPSFHGQGVCTTDCLFAFSARCSRLRPVSPSLCVRRKQGNGWQ